MSRRFLLAVCISVAARLFGQQAPAKEDVVLRALADELDRSRSLRLVALETPYYIEYGIHEVDSFAAGLRWAR